jgi:protein-tyrosine-phosphatase
MPEPNLEHIALSLSWRFHGVVSAETVQQLLAESHEAMRQSAKVQDYVMLLAERFTIQRLTALAQAERKLAKPVPEVLFVCDANAGRSQMAAALATARGEGRLNAHSAGLNPAAQVELAIVEVLAEIGIDVSAEFPKPLTDELVRAADIVITLGCGGACPISPATRYLNWPVPDPALQPLTEVRRIRDELDLLITDLLDSLDPRRA